MQKARIRFPSSIAIELIDCMISAHHAHPTREIWMRSSAGLFPSIHRIGSEGALAEMLGC